MTSKSRISLFKFNLNRIIITAIAIICVVAGGFVIFNQPQEAEAGWWDDTWLYRKPVAVTNNTSAESNVYVVVTIADTDDLITAGKMQADCGDLRWTEYNGIVLSYYIVSGCNTASTVVHIELESFPAGAQTIYYYYGNPSATDGFEASDFSTVASSYSIVSTGAEENGPGPVGYWSFDEGYGDTAYDSTDNANNGTRGGGVVANKPTWQTEDMCVSGKCLHFDGDNDYVDCGSGDSLDITDAITVSAWVKPSVFGVSQYLVDKFGGSDRSYGLSLESGGYYYLSISSNGSNAVNSGPSSAHTEANTWHHIVGVFIPSTSVSIYVDGVKENENTTSIPASLHSSSRDVYLGDYNTTGGYPFNGIIDEVRIYPYARTAAQIKKDYNAGLAGLGGGTEGLGAALGGGGSQKWMTDGLVGYWKMDESLWNGTADEVVDASGAENHGVRSGDATTAAGKFGKGGTFDGTGDYVDCGSGTSLNITDAITIEAWVKWTGTIGSAGYAVEAELGNYYTQIRKHNGSGSKIAFWHTAAATWFEGDTDVSQDVWHHIVVVFNKDLASQNVKFYLDGIEDGTGNTQTALVPTANELWIGNVETTSRFFNGSIDQVRIYNRALSPKEVRDLYNFAPGPVLHLKMDERVSGNAQTLYDISTNENNGTTYYGANATGMDCTVPGKFGTACDFDGVDDYVDCGSGSTLDITDAITIEAWVKPDNERVQVMSKDDQYFFHCGGGGDFNNVYFRFYQNGVGWATTHVTITDAVTQNTWNHIVGTFNGTSAKIYVNGAEEYTSNADSGKTIATTANHLWIGTSLAKAVYANGKIDDVRIYNYARTQKQITQDMNAGHPAVGSPVGSQVGYWKFDEGYGDTANDSSPQDNDGDLAGSCPGGATCPSWTNSGKFGKALSFDGGDYVDCGNNSSLNITDAITVSAWVKGAAQSAGKIASKYDYGTANRVWSLGSGQADTSKIEIYLSDDGTLDAGHYKQYISSITAFDDTWHYSVFTFNSGTLKIYVDGVEDTNPTKTNDDTITSLFSSSVDMNIGVVLDNGSAANWFNGTIDEVKIYNYALTEDEVRVEYNQGKAIVLGATGTELDGKTPSFSANREYCVPGDTTSCDPPVAEWKMDEKVSGNAQTLYDTSDNANNGTTYYGANATGMDCSIPGKFGTACDFDGTDDYVSVADHSSLRTADGTIEAWVKTTNDNADSLVAFGDTDAEALFAIYLGDGSTSQLTNELITILTGEIGNSTKNRVGYTTVTRTELFDGNWHHIVVTSGSIYGIYLDGISKTVTLGYGSNDGMFTDTTGIDNSRIGCKNFHSSGDGTFFNGTIDNVRIYDYARTPAQIAWSYNRGKPVAHWRFDECQGSIAHDASGNSNTGTITIGGTVPQTVLGTCETPVDGTGAWYNGVDGKINSAMSFDGVDDYVDCGTGSSLNIINNFTISMWINPNTIGHTMSLFEKVAGGPNRGFMFYTADSGANTNTFTLAAYGGDTANANADVLSDSGWQFLTVSKNGTSVSFYVDGSSAGSGTISSIVGHSGVTGYIGGGVLWGDEFDGLIDEVKVFNYALTAEQIKMEYNAGSAVHFK